MYFIFDWIKGFFGEHLFSRTLCDSICYIFRFGERTQVISCIGSCAAQICRYTKTKPCQGNQCSFLFICIWKNMAKHVFNKFMVLSPESHVARSYVGCCLLRGNMSSNNRTVSRQTPLNGQHWLAKSFLLVGCEKRFIFVIFPVLMALMSLISVLVYFFFFGYVKS